MRSLHRTIPNVGKWLSELEKNGIVRFKPGGFVWLHPGLKVLLREKLTGMAEKLDWDAQSRPFEIEFQIAVWYGRRLLASADPMAAVESVFHSLHAVQECHENSRCWDAEAAQAALEHSMLVIQLAFPLFECRLTDRFAGQALANLQSRVQRLQERLGDKPELLPVIAKLRRILQGQRGDLYIREGEFERACGADLRLPAGNSNSRPEELTQPAVVSFKWSCDLREADAATLLRSVDD